MNSSIRIKLFTCMVSFTWLLSCAKDDDTPPKEQPENLAVEMLAEVNRMRRAGCQCGTDFMPPVQELRWNDTLALAADRHVNDMYTHQYFDHISPQGSFPIQRAQEAGYTGNYVGENIARGYASISQVMTGWRKSESHCKAIMDSLYTEMGAAKVATYWVQAFGRSK